MRGKKALVTILIIIIIIGILFIGYFLLTRTKKGAEQEPQIVTTETPPPTYNIVVSAQDPIPRGWRFQSGDNAATVQQWPAEALPPSGYLTSLDQLNNKYAATDIPIGTPILENMLSEAPIAPFPAGRVAYGIPMDVQGGVGWHIQEGDHVDVLAAIELVNVDPEFQSKMPNLFQTLPEPNVENPTPSLSGVYGRFGTLPNGMASMILPNGDPYPQVFVQMTVQDAIVWRIGAQYTIEETPAAPQEAAAAPTPASGGGIVMQSQGAAATPVAQTLTNQRGDIELVTLLVAPQDALILKYLYEIGADLDLVIRAPNDTATWRTSPVWSRYVLEFYQIPQTGSDLPVATTPLRTPLELTPVATPPPAQQ
ncbi:MAG TPA: hypothetical protein PLJ78_06785 [Anaerolineae bacterium]|nr:hypothetical protein [Anaerolineae bacterium]HQK13632.1 hypothetical protein [Anaerolineae bacterium]